MTTCKHLIGGMCAISHGVCGHLCVDGKCERAETDGGNAATWRQALEIYLASDRSTSTKRGVAGSLKRAIEVLGREMDEPAVMDYNACDLLIRRLRGSAETDAEGKAYGGVRDGGYSDGYIQRILSEVSALSQKGLRREFAAKGLGLPKIEISEFEFEREEVKQLTEREVLKITDLISEWKLGAMGKIRVKKRNDFHQARCRNAYLATTIAMEFGLAFCDICDLKWSDFAMNPDIGGRELIYRRRKTGVKAMIVVSPSVWAKLEPFAGEGFVLVSDEKKIANGANPCRSFGSLHNFIGKAFAAIGVKGGKSGRQTLYRLRARFAQKVLDSRGSAAESAELGHSRNVARKFYTEERIKI